MVRRDPALPPPEEMTRRAKVRATKENESLARFAREAVERKLDEGPGHAAARRRHKRMPEEGMDPGTRGDPAVERGRPRERG